MRFSPADLRALVVFRSIVEHEGFTGAQLALGISQSTISFHLKALEDRLGFALCERGRGGFRLSEKGAALYDRSKALIAALSAFETELGELRRRATGTLRICVADNTVTDSAFAISAVIDRFLRQAEEAELRIKIAAPDDLISEFSKGGLDLVVSPQMERVADYHLTPLYEEWHALYCGDRHPLFDRRRPPSPAEVEQHPFVVRPYANRHELQHFPGATVRAMASNMEAQAMFVLSGRLLGYLPEHFARQWAEAGRMRTLLSPQTRIASSFVLVTRGQPRPPLLERLFVRELLARTGARQGTSAARGGTTSIPSM